MLSVLFDGAPEPHVSGPPDVDLWYASNGITPPETKNIEKRPCQNRKADKDTLTSGLGQVALNRFQPVITSPCKYICSLLPAITAQAKCLQTLQEWVVSVYLKHVLVWWRNRWLYCTETTAWEEILPVRMSSSSRAFYAFFFKRSISFTDLPFSGIVMEW